MIVYCVMLAGSQLRYHRTPPACLPQTLQSIAFLSSYSLQDSEARFLVVVPAVRWGTAGRRRHCACCWASGPVQGAASCSEPRAAAGCPPVLSVPGDESWDERVGTPMALQVVLHNWHAEFKHWLPQMPAGAPGLSANKASLWKEQACCMPVLDALCWGFSASTSCSRCGLPCLPCCLADLFVTECVTLNAGLPPCLPACLQICVVSKSKNESEPLVRAWFATPSGVLLITHTKFSDWGELWWACSLLQIAVTVCSVPWYCCLAMCALPLHAPAPSRLDCHASRIITMLRLLPQ